MAGQSEIERQCAVLAASLVIWAVPVVLTGLLCYRRHRLGRYLRERHPELWRRLGGGRVFADLGRFGAFLFDPHPEHGDASLERLRRGVRLMLFLALGSALLAPVLNVLSDRWLPALIGL
jgi:hypothetical protein